jgi:hypothetical protein
MKHGISAGNSFRAKNIKKSFCAILLHEIRILLQQIKQKSCKNECFEKYPEILKAGKPDCRKS